MKAFIGYAEGLHKHPEMPPGFQYAWLEGRMRAGLLKMAEVQEDWRDTEKWPSGRLFGDTGEYRWQITGTKIHAVMLLDEHNLPDMFKDQLELVSESDPAYLILYGDWVDPEIDPEGNPDGGPRYYAPEIPQVQTYPIDMEIIHGAKADLRKTKPRLVIRRYRHVVQEGGSHKGEFARCVKVCLKDDKQEGRP